MPDGNTPTVERPSVPIVLGVTGHRNMRDGDIPALKAAVGDVLREFREAYRGTPILLLSSLAAGADQLAAEVALEVASRSAEIIVRAPLPMPAHAYRRSTSFSTEEARATFAAMEANARVECFEVPLPAGEKPRPSRPVVGTLAREPAPIDGLRQRECWRGTAHRRAP